MKKSEVTEAMRRLMSPADQARFSSPEALSTSPPEKKKSRKRVAGVSESERAEQSKFWRHLKDQGVEMSTVWHRLDKRTGSTPGTPDFMVPLSGGRTLWMEFKLPGNTLSEDQEKFRDGLVIRAHMFHIVFSGAEAIALYDRLEKIS